MPNEFAGKWLFNGSVLIVFFLLIIPTPSLMAQGSAGRILGTVTDESGAAMAGTTLTITDTQRNVSRTLKTDESGAFNAPNLLPSTYTVRAESSGFKAVERKNIVLEVGGDVRVDLQLQPGELAQTVTVNEAAPLGGNNKRGTGWDATKRNDRYITLKRQEFRESSPAQARRDDLPGRHLIFREHQWLARQRQCIHG